MVDARATSAASLPPRLFQVLRELPFMAVALSGGLDSRFVCHAARLCGCDVLALHARGPHVPQEETSDALRWAAENAFPVLVVDYDPLSFPAVAQTARERCYVCKKGLMAHLWARLEAVGEGKRRVLCDGTNADDLHAYRPGVKALKEGGVLSPLARAHCCKADVRAAARMTGLDRPEQASRPCLLTRFAYGLVAERETLHRLDAAETGLALLAAREGAGSALGEFRLRLTPSPVLQAQHIPEDMRAPVCALLAKHGFASCTLVETPQVSGYFDGV